jgi:hypothetical protein
MVSVSIPGTYGLGNPHCLMLPGARRLSLSHGESLGAPFLFGRGVAVTEGQTGQQTGTSLIGSFNEVMIIAP